MKKRYINNSYFMEFVDEIATQLTELNFHEETFEMDNKTDKLSFTPESLEFYNDTDYLKIHEDPNDKTFYTFNYIKWYEEDDWCKEIMDFLEKVSEDNDNAFCRALGEDGVVHSEIGVYWDYVEQFSEINLID